MQKVEERIRKIYQKNKIEVDDDYIKNAMKNKKRVKRYMRLYKQEEIDSMQEILGKQHDNYYFTRKELDFVSKIDLFDPYMISVAKEIWKQKDNTKMLEIYLRILEKEGVTNVSSN